MRELPIQDYERVRKGQLLAQLVDDDYRAAVAQAEAGVLTATAQAQVLRTQHDLQLANIAAARAVVASASASVQQNDRDLARQHKAAGDSILVHGGAEKLSTAQAQLKAQLEQNRAQQRAAEQQLAVLGAQLAQSEAVIAAQRASLDAAKINLGYTAITATQDGVLGQRQVKPGEPSARRWAARSPPCSYPSPNVWGHRELQGDSV